ncbi:permease-like cell division protein FtsX [Amycolatopsis keratiniphila]|uniref:Cell division protein FtsX n=1 Tax=Amycolatopsis keratiniphila subsp. keratiniphila TaxID=227715 RepID=A0A1W2LNH2_9PSEU|nr:permease-like cell division protein FtsX [Amycolatopsis keratiniphila]OLZ44461.1 cell division protein FtsX [Amycolatopsis keratiniphila subsp. nogabecina]ONF64742.1 cell division protein FtsX [Amycolatopsis keratiniphila subsp. keratiniphila]SDU46974.1 cell division transport system permease protein [Amycolatopsis keratiniphila]
MRASFVFSEVVTGLRRNVTMTIAMILTTAVSLAMLGFGLLAVGTIDKMKANFLADVEVSVYLVNDISAGDPNCSQSACQTLRQELQGNEGVESVVFENREQSYERFKKMFESQPELLALTGPEALPASLHVKLKNPERSQAIIQEYTGKPGVSKVDDQQKALDRVFNALNGVRNLAFGAALIMAIAALLLIANTIQVSAFTRRTEVGIMRLVGATRWYTQLPFLLEAVVAGLVGAIIGIVFLILTKVLLLDLVLTGDVFPAVGMLELLFPVAPILLAVSIVISAITGYVTLRLYVRH